MLSPQLHPSVIGLCFCHQPFCALLFSCISFQSSYKAYFALNLLLILHWTITVLKSQGGLNYSFIYFFKILFIYFRQRGMEGKREGNINVRLPLTHPPHWEPGLQPKHVPWLGIEPEALGFAVWRSTHWATPAKAINYFFFKKSSWAEHCLWRFSDLYQVPWLPQRPRQRDCPKCRWFREEVYEWCPGRIQVVLNRSKFRTYPEVWTVLQEPLGIFQAPQGLELARNL